MKRWIFIWIIFLLLALPNGVGYAQEPGQVKLTSTIQREIEVVGEDGEKEIQLIEVGNAIPGDELIFTITYANEGSELAENVVLVNPVPEHTEYIDDSSGGAGMEIFYSVDGGGTYDLPANLQVTGNDGNRRAARAEEYTHIRWIHTVPLSPGESGNVFFRVRLK